MNFKEVMERTGVSRRTAQRRLKRFEAGEISEKDLLKPISTKNLMKKLGCSNTTALVRLRKFRAGEIDIKGLFKPLDKSQQRAGRKHKEFIVKDSKTEKDLLDMIPGETWYEKRYLND